jgi:hypothetical protein
MNMTERQKEIATGLTILLVTGFAFAAGEVSLKVVQMAKIGTPTTVQKSANRGPEIQVPKPRGMLRFAYLGSSTTLDPYSSDSESWPAVATGFLRQTVKSC